MISIVNTEFLWEDKLMKVINKEENTLIKNKLIQIYRFLQALNEQNNPVKKLINEQLWLMWINRFPNHSTINFGRMNKENIDDYILKVRRPELSSCPEPPTEIKEWLKPGWQKYNGDVSLIPEKQVKIDGGQTELIFFADNSELVKLYEDWLKLRDKWIEVERLAREAMDVYERLFDLYARIERESEQVELLLGDGILYWGKYDINHPILLRKIKIEFNPNVPEFTLIETDQTSELYTSLLRLINDVQPQAISRLNEDLEQGNWHPLDDDGTDEFFQRVISQLSAKGEFIEENVHKQDPDIPQISRNPVIFLRKRSIGFTHALESILENISQMEDYPEAVSRIVGIHSKENNEKKDITLINIDVNGEDENVLLSKEANSEQLKIALQLERYGSVLVQGPPGTGKTHTIANLLGHFLTQGKTVLVTSHTSKALAVLREKVVEPLKSLCVSVLDDDNGKVQLENSIDVINERLSSIDVAELEKEVKFLEDSRRQILTKLRKLREALKKARVAEYIPIVYGGKEYDPSKAARLIAKEYEINGWIPEPVELGAPLPLSLDELVELYQSNKLLRPVDEYQLGFNLPKIDDLMKPDEFNNIIDEINDLSQKALNNRKDLWSNSEQDYEQLNNLVNRLREVHFFLSINEWKDSILLAGKKGVPDKKTWEELLHYINSINELSRLENFYFNKYGPEIPNELDLYDVEKTTQKIIEYLRKKNKISIIKLLFNNTWRTVVHNTKVNGKAPQTKEEFEALHYHAKLGIARKELLMRWERQITSINGPKPTELGNNPEVIAYQYAEEIKKWIDWFAIEWSDLEKEIKRQGFSWDKAFSESSTVKNINKEITQLKNTIKNVISIFDAKLHILKYEKNKKRLESFKEKIDSFQNGRKSEILNKILDAINSSDKNKYINAYQRISELEEKRNIYNQRSELLKKLNSFAPNWAEAIKERLGIHGLGDIPGDVEKAWELRQLYDELEKRSKISIENIQGEIDKWSNKLRNITVELIEKKTWMEQARRTNRKHREALSGWKAIMKKVGKGTGKRVPRLLDEARELMIFAKEAVPVWIMPISRAVEYFDPQKNRFDIVIIDEASQSDVMALTALYFGKQVVVVGDDEQVSPDAVGQKLDDIQRIIDSMLDGIPNKQLYDGKTSIYDLAKISFEGKVQLREHFRCVEPIIQFSNYLSYNGEIRPLRDASNVKIKPATVPYRVEGFDTNKVNEVEAIHVASLLIAATEQEEYKDSTFGVISLIGDDQAQKIDTLLRRYLPPVEYKNRLIRCGNSSQFQGDERDVIFLSMVHGPFGNGPLPLLSDPGERMKKRFNVAASRAKDQLWLVYSLNPDIDLKDRDIRKMLIQHIQDPYAIKNSFEQKAQETESEFERLVLKRLHIAGYKVTPQWKVGSFRIDMVVEGNGKRLAVECDGDRFHTIKQLEEDMARQAILERLGWKFVRIRGSAFFRDQEKAMIPVFEKLKELDIPPEAHTESIHNNDQFGEELKTRIIRRAAEIRKEWEEQSE